MSEDNISGSLLDYEIWNIRCYLDSLCSKKKELTDNEAYELRGILSNSLRKIDFEIRERKFGL